MTNLKKRECKVRITDAMNTYSHALTSLRSRGYSVFVYPADGPDSLSDYWAIKDGRTFIADSPVSVLGLVALWEDYGDDWRDAPVPDEVTRVWRWSVSDDDYAAMSDDEFAALIKEARLYLAALEIDLPMQVTRNELAAIMNSYYREPTGQ